MRDMESYLIKVYKAIATVFNTEVNVETETPKYVSYPYTSAWKGHNDAIGKIINSKFSLLSSSTGTGKTVVYLTSAVESGLRTLIIVPRNGLQVQVSEYETKMNIPIRYLFDRNKECNKKSSENLPAPCSAKFKKGGKWYFKMNGKIVEFPCKDCPYEEKKQIIKTLFEEGECIAVLNQGNFWMLRHQAEFVIIDEADETLRSITSAISYPGQFNSSDPKEVLEWMRENIEDDIKKIENLLEKERNENKLLDLNKELNKLERKLSRIGFFLNYPDEKLITYHKGKSTYVEIFDDMVSTAKRLFQNHKVCLVTATPSSEEANKIEFSLPFRAKVIYAPVGNMSERNVFRKNNLHLLEKAVEVMMKTYDYTVKLTGMRKAPVHCGNLSKHGLRVYELFKSNGRKVLLMEEGLQAKSIEKFIEGDYDFFCAVAIEYGYDWGFSPIQYILKVPFADLGDPRIQAIRKKLDKDKFDDWYNWDALSRLIQACGRNARNPNDFGITIILDSCFERLYKRYEDKIPKWFKDRLIWLEGLDGESGS